MNEAPYFCCGNLPSERHKTTCRSAEDGERISCGCCRGDEGHRCVCWMHQDAPMGRPAGVCDLHAEHARSYMPLRYAR